MDRSFEGKVVLVTGAAGGIGRATAVAFGRRGARVVIADVCDLAWVASGGRVSAPEVLAVTCDVSRDDDVRALVARAVERFGRLDCAYNNAGIEGEPAATHECSEENWDRTLAVNLKGVWLCLRHEIPQMLKQGGGTIVNCASVAGLVGIAGLPAYEASKHGVVGLTRTAALETVKQNIRINAVCPGAILTPMLERFMASSPEARATVVASEPIGRIGKPEEIAECVLWLCSDASSFVTGQALAADGGWTVQ
jgi:NAD(P)-dependent dehydrogenase (short-subunit alcohol dehydrogenase family)